MQLMRQMQQMRLFVLDVNLGMNSLIILVSKILIQFQIVKVILINLHVSFVMMCR